MRPLNQRALKPEDTSGREAVRAPASAVRVGSRADLPGLRGKSLNGGEKRPGTKTLVLLPCFSCLHIYWAGQRRKDEVSRREQEPQAVRTARRVRDTQFLVRRAKVTLVEDPAPYIFVSPPHISPFPLPYPSFPYLPP